jgi:hypothetical protein
MKKANKDLIDFFQMQMAEEKSKLLEVYITEVERQLGFKTTIPDDEIRLIWEKNKELPGSLQNFASVLYEQIMAGVCNVIATA